MQIVAYESTDFCTVQDAYVGGDVLRSSCAFAVLGYRKSLESRRCHEDRCKWLERSPRVCMGTFQNRPIFGRGREVFEGVGDGQ